MSNLQKLFNDFIKNPKLKEQEEIAKFYIKDAENREENKKEIIDFLKGNIPEGEVNWPMFFESDRKFWENIYLIDIEKDARKSYDRVFKTNGDVDLIDMAIDLCIASCRNVKEIYGMGEKIEKIWSQVFADVSNFNDLLEKNKKESEERLRSYLNLRAKTPTEKIKYKTLEISIPVIAYYYDKEEKQKKEINIYRLLEDSIFQEFMENRITEFNNFNLVGYMDTPQCNLVKMRIEEANNIFTLELNEEMNLDKLKKSLFGQLTDGLGENLAQRGAIIGDKEYYFDFDITNASDFTEVLDKKYKL